METEDLKGWLVGTALVACIILLVVASGHGGKKHGEREVQAQAIHHGYGTYDKDGKFQWVIKG